MQRIALVSLIGLGMALTACGNEQDATPDITEAIPLNIDEEGDASIAAGNDAASGDATSGDTPALPGATGGGMPGARYAPVLFPGIPRIILIIVSAE